MSLRMQAQTAARFEDILAHVTLTGAGSRDSRLLPIWDQTRVWDPGDEPPLKRAGACGRPPNKPAAAKPPLAVREDGGVVWSSDGAPFAHPVSCLLEAVCLVINSLTSGKHKLWGIAAAAGARVRGVARGVRQAHGGATPTPRRDINMIGHTKGTHATSTKQRYRRDREPERRGTAH